MNQRALSLLLPAMIAPWILLLAAWRRVSQRQRHWLLTFFITFYGATIAIAYDPLGRGPDGVRHLLNVYTHYVGLSFEQFLSELWLILTLRPPLDTKGDVYLHVLSYFTGGLLSEPKFLFPIVAFVYGYFFSGAMLEVFQHVGEKKRSYLFVFFALLFVLIKNIEGVNTIRTWTGLWILVYACLKYYSTKQIKYVLLMFVPPLVHVGWFVMAVPAWIVLVLGNRKVLYAALFVVSSFTTFVNPGTVTEVLSTTELGAAKVQSYYVEEALDMTAAGQRFWKWITEFGLQKWALNTLVYSLFISRVYFVTMNRFQASIFSIGLLTITLSNSSWYLFALTNRSWIAGAIFILAAFLSVLQDQETGPKVPVSNPVYKIGLHISLLLFVPYLFYNLSTLIDYPSVFLAGLPFLAILAPEANMSIKEAARFILDMLF